MKVTKGNTYNYTLSVSDVDVGDQLTITPTTLPSWLSFDPGTQTLSGTPSGSDLGVASVAFEVSDGMLSTSQSFTIDINNSIGSLVVLVDQFSDRIFDLGHQNLTLFDYGYFHQMRWIDYDWNGYTGYDTYQYLNEDLYGGFYPVTPDTEPSYYPATFIAETTNYFDYDHYDTGLMITTNGRYVYDDYYVFNRMDQTSDSSVNHGDWALEALLQQLDNPEKTAIIAIDLDTLNGASSHYQKLFDSAIYSLPGFGIDIGTTVEQILANWLTLNDYRISNNTAHDDYSLSAFSISIAGAPATTEIATLDTLASLSAPIVQAAPNVNQGIYDWGTNYPDVINVGAWDKDANGNLLISSEETFGTVDILADGLVSKSGWGSNFGTSFATPRVTGEIANLMVEIIESIEATGTSIGEAQQDSAELEIDYSDLVNTLIEVIGTSVSFTIDDDGVTSQHVEVVLTDDLSPTTEPTIVSDMRISEDVAWGIITDIEIV